MMIYDERKDKTRPVEECLCATDKFMSGWGQVPNGTSYVCYDVRYLNDQQKVALATWMDGRCDYIRVRHNLRGPTRGTDRDHLSVYDPPGFIVGGNQ